jgi:hypothetical protein
MADGDRRPLLAGQGLERLEALRNGGRRAVIVQEDVAPEIGHAQLRGRLARHRLGSSERVEEEELAAARQDAHDLAHRRLLAGEHAAHVVAHAGGVRHGREVIVDGHGQLERRHRGVQPARSFLRSRRRLHGQMEQHFLAGGMRLLGELAAVRRVRQDGAGDRAGEPYDPPSLGQAVSEIVDDDGDVGGRLRGERGGEQQNCGNE